MLIALIAAMTDQRVIGKNNQLPWHLPADLQHFKTVTMGKPVIMGRKTYQSIGNALPGRKNIIISHDPEFKALNCEIYHALDEALSAVENHPEIFIIGGAEIYKQTLPLAQRLYITFIHADIAGDSYFPVWPASEWREIQREDYGRDEKNPYPFSFVTLEKI